MPCHPYIVYVFVLAWNISRVDGSTTTTTQSVMGGGVGRVGWLGGPTHYVDTQDEVALG
jgi:hypothetical protein